MKSNKRAQFVMSSWGRLILVLILLFILLIVLGLKFKPGFMSSIDLFDIW